VVKKIEALWIWAIFQNARFMKNAKTRLIVGSLALVCCAIAIWVLAVAKRTAEPLVQGSPTVSASNPAGLQPIQVTVVRADLPEARPVAAAEASPVGDAIPPKTTNTVQQAKSGKKELLDPLAREALIYVGADPEAEAYWFGAINDPTLPPNERQDLIEDLNEEGLSDPQNPGPEDLPLIISRIEIIEELGPDSMDEVNFNAFKEAYKDLWDLLAIAREQVGKRNN